jgi:uncharacterized membrane protein YheB (UPF0754 family)
MILTSKHLKSVIIQESLEALVLNQRYHEAAILHSNNRNHLEEGWLKNFVKKVSGTWAPALPPDESEDVPQIEDIEAEEAVEDAFGLLAKKLEQSGSYTKSQAQNFAAKFIKNDPNLTSVDYENILNLLYAIPEEAFQQTMTQVVNAEEEEEKTVDGEGEESEVEAEASISDVSGELKQMLSNTTERSQLLTGLVKIFTNPSVSRILDTIQPAGAAAAVKKLIQTLGKMDPDTLAALESEFAGEELEKHAKYGGGYGGRWGAQQKGTEKVGALMRERRIQALMLKLVMECRKLKII